MVLADPGWYDSSWSYRKKITIDNTKVTANLADFPVLVYLSSDSDLANDAQPDGDDILFTAADETTQLSHEIENFNNGTGELVAWVKVPSLSSSSDTIIYMYYGNAGISSQQNASGVWDANYKMVQHLQEDTGGANSILDSTANGNHGTDNSTPTLGATGKIDGATFFDGSGELIDIDDSASLDITDNITLEAWVNPTTVDTNHRRIVIKSHDTWEAPHYMYSLWVHSTGLGFGFNDGTTRIYSNEGTVSTGSWQYVAATYNGTVQEWYINGSSVGTQNATGTIVTNDQPLIIGSALGTTTRFHGSIDEVRISNVARSSDWLQTSYNNQNTPSTFFSPLGSEESSPAAPISVGAPVFPINKFRVMAPWLGVAFVFLSVVIGGSLFSRRTLGSRSKNR
ncbi:DUF2341 domain-containing protein [Bacteroidota bacterium]